MQIVRSLLPQEFSFIHLSLKTSIFIMIISSKLCCKPTYMLTSVTAFIIMKHREPHFEIIGRTSSVQAIDHVVFGSGTGKEHGDRHPKVSDNVLIGAAATILGSITIGKGAMVAAGSLVLKSVPSKVMVAGSPAKEIGKLQGELPKVLFSLVTILRFKQLMPRK